MQKTIKREEFAMTISISNSKSDLQYYDDLILSIFRPANKLREAHFRFMPTILGKRSLISIFFKTKKKFFRI